jgi:hypothetical protein
MPDVDDMWDDEEDLAPFVKPSPRLGTDMLHPDDPAPVDPAAEARGMERAARMLDRKHISYMTSRARDPEKYASEFSLLAKDIRDGARALLAAQQGAKA